MKPKTNNTKIGYLLTQTRVDFILFILIFLSIFTISIIVYHWQRIKLSFVSQTDTLKTVHDTSSAISVIRAENIRKLESYFAKNESPLYPYARFIVQQAETYGIDYRLLPAIAMNESTLCKNIHENSYNCWGWGIYGNTLTKFDDYEDAIRVISKGLREQYYNKGMSSPSAIMKVYTPTSPEGVWAKKIEWTFRQIDKL